MLSFCLLALHMLGDYVLQNDWIAARKLRDWQVRLFHVTLYTAPFLLLGEQYGLRDWRIAWFGLAVGVPHFIVDSRRFRTESPWPPMPIVYDQTLHIICLAVAGLAFFGR